MGISVADSYSHRNSVVHDPTMSENRTVTLEDLSKQRVTEAKPPTSRSDVKPSDRSAPDTIGQGLSSQPVRPETTIASSAQSSNDSTGHLEPRAGPMKPTSTRRSEKSTSRS
ncbi:hypothetical protein CLAIMM_06886 [Cladophialophora immunda]|nr:hypothetical protein CLAIMM_06886 [Cladophialophora immunda]